MASELASLYVHDSPGNAAGWSTGTTMSNMKLLAEYPLSRAAAGSSVQRTACSPPRPRVTVRLAAGNGVVRPSSDSVDSGRPARGTAGVGPGSTASAKVGLVVGGTAAGVIATALGGDDGRAGGDAGPVDRLGGGTDDQRRRRRPRQ